jgi:hypothetical protein
MEGIELKMLMTWSQPLDQNTAQDLIVNTVIVRFMWNKDMGVIQQW